MQALEDCGIILLVEGSLYRPLGRIDFMEPSLLVAGAVFAFDNTSYRGYNILNKTAEGNRNFPTRQNKCLHK